MRCTLFNSFGPGTNVDQLTPMKILRRNSVVFIAGCSAAPNLLCCLCGGDWHCLPWGLGVLIWSRWLWCWWAWGIFLLLFYNWNCKDDNKECFCIIIVSECGSYTVEYHWTLVLYSRVRSTCDEFTIKLYKLAFTITIAKMRKTGSNIILLCWLNIYLLDQYCTLWVCAYFLITRDIKQYAYCVRHDLCSQLSADSIYWMKVIEGLI